jgi:hypothetical protein
MLGTLFTTMCVASRRSLSSNSLETLTVMHHSIGFMESYVTQGNRCSCKLNAPCSQTCVQAYQYCIDNGKDIIRLKSKHSSTFCRAIYQLCLLSPLPRAREHVLCSEGCMSLTKGRTAGCPCWVRVSSQTLSANVLNRMNYLQAFDDSECCPRVQLLCALFHIAFWRRERPQANRLVGHEWNVLSERKSYSLLCFLCPLPGVPG